MDMQSFTNSIRSIPSLRLLDFMTCRATKIGEFPFGAIGSIGFGGHGAIHLRHYW
jgi:hypothetical protein